MKPADPPAQVALPDSRGTNLFHADPAYLPLLRHYMAPKLLEHLLPEPAHHADPRERLAHAPVDPLGVLPY